MIFATPYSYDFYDIILFIIIPFIIIPISLYVSINYRFHINKYPSTKFFFYLLVPSAFIASFCFYYEVYRYFHGMFPFFYPQLMEINSLLIYGILLILGSILMIMFGKNWILRRRYFFKNNFGPYLIYTSTPDSSIKICGRISYKTRKLTEKTPSLLLLKYRKSNNQNDKNEFVTSPIKIGWKGTWTVELKNLEPNTIYEYQTAIYHNQQIYSFKTAPNQNSTDNDPIEFFALGDFHGGGSNIQWVTNLIEKKYPMTSFIISGGDTVSDGRNFTHWKTFFGQLNGFTAKYPIIHCTGNHDASIPKMVKFWSNFLPYEFSDLQSGLYHYYIFKNALFIFLDNYNAGKSNPLPSANQIAWLGVLLETHKDIKYKFMIMHETFYSTSTHGFNHELESIISPFFEKYHITAIFSSHVHLFEHFYRPDFGTSIFTTGGGGGRIEHAIFRKINRPIYYWEGPIHQAKKKFFSKGQRKSLLRNDEIVKKYQEYGFSKKHIIHVILANNEILYEAVGKHGEILYKFVQKLEIEKLEKDKRVLESIDIIE